MGMFDEIRIAAPHNEALDPRVRDATFQTKDFECWMNMYEISSDGRLIERINEFDELDTEYHGDIVFYTLLHRPTVKAQFDDGVLLKYKARFTDGVLQWIRPVFPESGTVAKYTIEQGAPVATETSFTENEDGTITVHTEIDLGEE